MHGSVDKMYKCSVDYIDICIDKNGTVVFDNNNNNDGININIPRTLSTSKSGLVLHYYCYY